MNASQFFTLLNETDSSYLATAHKSMTEKPARMWFRPALIAACLTLVLVAIPVGIMIGNRTIKPSVPVITPTTTDNTVTTTPITTASTTIPATTSVSPTLVIPENYQALYIPGAMNGLSSSAGAYSGALLQGVKKYEKTNVNSQTFAVLESSGAYRYKRTEKTAFFPYDVDVFVSSASAVLIRVNSETGEIVHFNGVSDPQKLANSPVFTSESTEKDYIAYAKTILSDLISESLDQYMVTVETSLIHNGIKESTYYHISFAKTISGIPCRNEYEVGVFEDGSIGFYSLLFNQEGFAPFENLVIDKAKLDKIVMANYKADTASLNVFSHESPEHYLYVEDGVLWAQSSIDFKYEHSNTNEVPGSVCYMIKLAEVKTPSADKVTKP